MLTGSHTVREAVLPPCLTSSLSLKHPLEGKPHIVTVSTAHAGSKHALIA